jgi:PPM family protein phosphatase
LSGARLHVVCAAKTDVGLIRSGNEDNYLMVPERGIFLVADGMGGHAAGEVASEMAVQLISRDLGSLKGLSVDEAASRMTQAIKGANGAIFERTISESDKRGMGTTTTALVLHGANRYLIGQVGDSRAYLLRENRFHQLTKDHSYVQEQVDLGYLTPEQARSHPYANVITRCVGASADVMPDIFSGTVRPGDVFLLASDGLTGMVEDDALAGILQAQGNPEKWVDKLVSEANRRGGLDNITCIIVHVDEIEAVPTEATTTGESPAAL